ncbi:MAG: hypothetical protein MUC88_23480 [Planctomycetes bacterium]|nr:hypothetical protein [Planctomycetota bacterium]
MMGSRNWFRGLRLFLGFLVAPAVVPLTLHVALSVTIAGLGLDLTAQTTRSLRVFELTFGVGMVYLCMFCFGLPYIVLLAKADRLNVRTIMIPALILSWVYSVLVYAVLQQDFSFAGTVAAACVPGVLLAGLCFYFLAVWRSHGGTVPMSPLLEAYSTPPRPTLQV